ncbi:hypothetical protein [Aquimarina sp. 2201CG5-10]|uniref:hypothetical protein n=1 Tax=Aquimarina callyspongiae TaxID=3098150 RepID=UPI002AB59C19|nr:hypothetical protein [Aquimarina sp. 2201CG5-10]MDY8138113.1 hypothetical protein [Aquimarina sp. 2201CG5-10]
MNTILKHSIQIFLFAYSFCGFAQVLDIEKGIRIALSDSSEVQLYKKIDAFDENSQEYYYLPTHLKFSTSKDKAPEFSLLMYEEENKNKGAILHFLVSWGLAKEQLEEVDLALKNAKGEDARLMGAVIPELDQEQTQLYIKGASPLVSILNNSITAIGKTTVFPNSKIAGSFKLNSEESQTFNKAIQENSESLKETFLAMNFVISFRKNKEVYPQKISYQLEQNLHELLNKSL